MPDPVVRDMTVEDECFVASCSHAREPRAMSSCATERLAWLKRMQPEGFRSKVAVVDRRQIGFAFVTPIEISPTGPIGTALMVMPCLFVCWEEQGKHGAGRALLEAAEQETLRQQRKALVVPANYHDFWFMPASFFEKYGYVAVQRQGEKALMWKVFDRAAETPVFLKPRFEYQAVPGKVVVDLFWMSFCGMEDKGEVLRVASAYGDAVIVRDHCTDDPMVRCTCQIPRAFFVNGVEAQWDHENAERGIRQALDNALKSL